GVCTHFYAHGKSYPVELREQVADGLAAIERLLGARFGDADNPLLVSVRSGARVSMPGMMDTVLNLGLNDRAVAGLARRSGDERFAYDSYRRFIQMYGRVVVGIENHFEELLENHKLDTGVTLDTDLSAQDWRTIVAGFKDLVAQELGHPFPEEPKAQLWGAIGAVFGSWMNPRAVTYRRLHDIPADWGTAVNVQAMVFVNMEADRRRGPSAPRPRGHRARDGVRGAGLRAGRVARGHVRGRRSRVRRGASRARYYRPRRGEHAIHRHYARGHGNRDA